MKEVKGYTWPDSATESNIKCSTQRVKSLQWVIDNWKRKEVVIQAGGSYGVWPRILSKHFQTVYTFEPEPQAFRCLCINCPSENIIKVQGALGEGKGTVKLNKKSWSSHKVQTSEQGEVLYFSIDSLDIKKVDAILLDIEGHEYQALCGASNTIRYHRPIILVEGGFKKEAPQEIIDRVKKAEEKILSFSYQKVADIGRDQIYTYKGEL